MAKRRTRTEIELERAADAACQYVLIGVQINMMDIPKLSREANRLLADGMRGADLLSNLRSYVLALTTEAKA